MTTPLGRENTHMVLPPSPHHYHHSSQAYLCLKMEPVNLTFCAATVGRKNGRNFCCKICQMSLYVLSMLPRHLAPLNTHRYVRTITLCVLYIRHRVTVCGVRFLNFFLWNDHYLHSCVASPWHWPCDSVCDITSVFFSWCGIVIYISLKDSHSCGNV